MNNHYSVVIVGGGQAGLSISYCLKERGFDHIIFDIRMPNSLTGLLDPTRLLFDLQQGNEIAQGFSGGMEPEEIARRVTNGLVEKFDCAFARILCVCPDLASGTRPNNPKTSCFLGFVYSYQWSVCSNPNGSI